MILTATALALAVAATIIASPTDGKTLVWHDEFNTPTGIWQPREAGTKCPTCVTQRDGDLVLSVRNVDGRWVGGQVGTKRRAEFTYGYFEAKVCFPTDRGVLSGWWLAPSTDYEVGQSEVDIAENAGLRKIQHAVHWRTDGMGAGEFLVERAATVAGEVCHRLGALWTAVGYTFFVDGNPTATISNGLSGLGKFLVLSMKLPRYLRAKFDPTVPHEMRVKYVRVWQ